MKNKIEKILQETPNLRGAQIAKKIGADKTAVNAFLHDHKNIFIQDSNYCWSLVAANTSMTITFPEDRWLNCSDFEISLKQANSPWDENISSVIFVIPKNCNILLEAIARLLAICNQLAHAGKIVTLDFSQYMKAFTFFDRTGFIELLHDSIQVLPNRPAISRGNLYKGNSDALVEFRVIDPHTKNDEIVKQLTNAFVKQTDDSYTTTALTIFGELIKNIEEHSNTQISGFSAFQRYGGQSKHFQTVVSDSGDGIAKTLLPALQVHYPEIYNLYKNGSIDSEAGLIITAFRQGEISRHGSLEGRGLGLNRSQAQAIKLKAKLSIRQETYSLLLTYNDGDVVGVDKTLDLVKIGGTHICFDFLVS